jgi:death-on-curing protein
VAHPIWLERELIIRLHDYVLAETGGASGVRDIGLLESALARPMNRCLYEGIDDLLELAATYAIRIAGNHPFIDGNKRAAFMALGLFLDDNGLQLSAVPQDATDIMLGVAAGKIDIAALTEWLRSRVTAA